MKQRTRDRKTIRTGAGKWPVEEKLASVGFGISMVTGFGDSER
jgi:hypothetical protein